jgi:quinol monooxygenase YgiN
MMYARVTSATIHKDRLDELSALMETSIIPVLEQQAGFAGYFLLVDPETGSGLNVTLWQSEADMNASESSNFYQQQVNKAAALMAAPSTFSTYQVVIQA